MLPNAPDHFLQTRTVLLFGEVTPALAQTATEQLLVLAARSEAGIKLVVNAQGGAVSTGEALYDVVAGLGQRVLVIGAGAVSHAAALAFVAPPVGQRFCLPHARFSLQQSLGGGGFARQDLLAQQRRRLQALFARQTHMPTYPRTHTRFFHRAASATQPSASRCSTTSKCSAARPA